MLDLEGPRILTAYDALLPGAFKADLWRVVMLYHHGGVYADDKLTLLQPLDQIIPQGTGFDGLLMMDWQDRHIQNAFIAITPKHRLLRCTMDAIVKNVENRFYGEEPWEISGPPVLGACYARLFNAHKKILPIRWKFWTIEYFITERHLSS